MQRHSKLPFHQACSSISINPQGIEDCFKEHEMERATEVDDQQMMTALHILCANPHVTGDCTYPCLSAIRSLQKLPTSKTLKELLLFSIFVAAPASGGN